MIKKIVKTMLWCCIWLGSLQVVYGKNVAVTQLGNRGEAYITTFNAQKATISRDGSEATTITSGTKITLPGKYYLCIEGANGMEIQTFTITKTNTDTSFQVKREGELDEILKGALEKRQPQIVLHFQYGSFSADTMQTMIHDHIQNVISKYPALTYNGGSIELLGNSKPTVTLRFKYPLKAESNMKSYQDKTDAALTSLLEENLTTEMTPFEREQALFEKLMTTIKYSGEVVNGDYVVNATTLSHTMWGAMVDGVAVCDGYAKSLMYALNAVGIPNELVIGTSKGESHAWNLVKLECGYYHVDLTWADQEEGTLGVVPHYFNELDSYMKVSHQWNVTKYPKTSENTYCITNAPFQVKGLYKVQNQSDWQAILGVMKCERLKGGTIIFYKTSVNKWDKDKVITQLCNGLGKNLSYLAETKYDALVIDYRVK